ncbi:MAG: hypothetical protein ACI93R_003454 [Flavobacteriales bacterium]
MNINDIIIYFFGIKPQCLSFCMLLQFSIKLLLAASSVAVWVFQDLKVIVIGSKC